MSELQIVIVKLNGELSGIETDQVESLVRYNSVLNKENMPVWLFGYMPFRQTNIPVVDLNQRFGLGQAGITKKSKVVVSQTCNKTIGYLVNDVLEIIHVPESDIETTPATLTGRGVDHVRCIAKRNADVISVLDMNKLMREDEVLAVTEASAQPV